MPIELCSNLDAINLIRDMDTPKHIKEDFRECINCIHWRNLNGVEGKCLCKGSVSDNKGLYTWYSETCCYCFLRSKYEIDYDGTERVRYIRENPRREW